MNLQRVKPLRLPSTLLTLLLSKKVITSRNIILSKWLITMRGKSKLGVYSYYVDGKGRNKKPKHSTFGHGCISKACKKGRLGINFRKVA